MVPCIPPSWYATSFHALLKHMTWGSTYIAQHWWQEKKCNYCINHSKYDTKISSCGWRPIITYNVRGSHTNCFECNQIFIFECFSSIHFEPFCLSLDEASISILLWMCGLTCSVYMFEPRMHVGPLLVFCVSAPDWAWQPCTISCYGTQPHRQRTKEEHQMRLVKQSFRTCEPFHTHPTYVMGSSN